MYDEKLTSQEYRRRRRRVLDELVDNGELLNSMALRYSLRRQRRQAFWRNFWKGLAIFGTIATPLIAASDRVVEFFNWLRHGGH